MKWLLHRYPFLGVLKSINSKEFLSVKPVFGKPFDESYEFSITKIAYDVSKCFFGSNSSSCIYIVFDPLRKTTGHNRVGEPQFRGLSRKQSEDVPLTSSSFIWSTSFLYQCMTSEKSDLKARRLIVGRIQRCIFFRSPHFESSWKAVEHIVHNRSQSLFTWCIIT